MVKGQEGPFMLWKDGYCCRPMLPNLFHRNGNVCTAPWGELEGNWVVGASCSRLEGTGPWLGWSVWQSQSLFGYHGIKRMITS